MKKINKFDKVPMFTEKQLDKQLEKQIRFLRTIYPFLNDENNWNEGCIEIRPIKRDKNVKQYVKSYNTWHLKEKDIEALREFLQIVNGKGFCLYFSTFAFDFHKEVLKKNSKLFEKGKINNQNALFTTILPMDFDNISFQEFQEQKQKLMDLGIETLDIFSGHGFQSFILLDRKVYDRDILKKFTKVMLSKGFKIDEALVDPARVVRQPYTFNCKAMDKKSKYYDAVCPEILPTTDINWTERRYHIADIFKKINSLPDVIPQEHPITEFEIKAIKTASMTKNEKKKEENKIKEVKKIKIESLKTVYSMLDFEKLEEPIQKMLQGSQSGLRNKVMLFIIPFLRNSLGLSIQTIKQIMTIWGKRCSPSLDKDFVTAEVDRLYKYGLKAKFGAYTEELRKAYGYLEFTKFTRQNKITIPNSIFDDFDVIKDGAVRIYLSLKLAEAIDGVKEFTKKDIQMAADIVERTVERNIKDLVNMGYICKRRTNRRIGEEYIYYINPYFSTTAGFTMLENAVVRMMLKELTDGEMKLYSYLCRMIGDSQTDCWASQKYLAKQIGKAGQNAISMMTDSLNEKKFITKKTEKKDGIMHSIYNLNY